MVMAGAAVVSARKRRRKKAPKKGGEEASRKRVEPSLAINDLVYVLLLLICSNALWRQAKKLRGCRIDMSCRYSIRCAFKLLNSIFSHCSASFFDFILEFKFPKLCLTSFKFRGINNIKYLIIKNVIVYCAPMALLSSNVIIVI
jgi:hypothetical protein